MAMKLKTQIVLALILVIALVATGLAFQQIRAIRTSIGEEMETAGDIGAQVLSRVNEIYQYEGVRPMQRFLTRLGRLRAHDILLVDEFGVALYRTPATDYLSDISVPEWFERSVSPDETEREFQLANAKLIVRTDGSRATIEGWQEFKKRLLVIALGSIALSAFAWWLVDRAMRPFTKVNDALRSVGKGDFSVRLSELPGSEANELGKSFNQMTNNVEASLAAHEAEAIAKAELRKNRQLTQVMQRRTEQEHRSLAQELHDELGQHVTAIKSMAVSIVRRTEGAEPTVANTAGQIVASADSVHATIRHMLVHLRPASLDQFGLTDAITDLVSDWRTKHPNLKFNLVCAALPDRLSSDLSTATYRIAQEAITNAVRHSGADTIEVRLGFDTQQLILEIKDNGVGMEHQVDLGFGITGMRERATSQSGKLDIATRHNGGCTVLFKAPIHQ